MIQPRDTAFPTPAEPPVAPVTVQAVSADEGLRVLITALRSESLLEASAARELAHQLVAAADLVGTPD